MYYYVCESPNSFVRLLGIMLLPLGIFTLFYLAQCNSVGPSRLASPKCIILETVEFFCVSLTEKTPPSGLKRLAEALYWLQHKT